MILAQSWCACFHTDVKVAEQSLLLRSKNAHRLKCTLTLCNSWLSQNSPGPLYPCRREHPCCAALCVFTHMLEEISIPSIIIALLRSRPHRLHGDYREIPGCWKCLFCWRIPRRAVPMWIIPIKMSSSCWFLWARVGEPCTVQVQVILRAWLDANSLGSKTNTGNELDPAESKDMVCVIVPTHSLLWVLSVAAVVFVFSWLSGGCGGLGFSS